MVILGTYINVQQCKLIERKSQMSLHVLARRMH